MRAVLFRVVAAALAVSLLTAIPQKKSIKRVISACCGALLLLTVMGPLLTLRGVDLKDYFDRFQPDAALIDESVRDGQKQAAALITEQTTAYILDKAGTLGMQVEAEVTLAALSEHYQYPYAVTLSGRWTRTQRQELSSFISQTLGIPAERQTWRERAS